MGIAKALMCGVAGVLAWAAGPVLAGQDAQTGMLGISPAGVEILRSIDAAPNDRGVDAMADVAREARLRALEADQINTLELAKAVEAERIAARMKADRRFDRAFEAYLKLSAADRKAAVKAERGMRAAVIEKQMQK